jgi:hypothetical protein
MAVDHAVGLDERNRRQLAGFEFAEEVDRILDVRGALRRVAMIEVA